MGEQITKEQMAVDIISAVANITPDRMWEIYRNQPTHYLSRRVRSLARLPVKELRTSHGTALSVHDRREKMYKGEAVNG